MAEPPADPESPTQPSRHADVVAEPLRPATLLGADLSPGTRVGDYVVDARRGGGGFASVYRAHHVDTGAPVALKVLHAYLVRTPSILRRFRLEAETVARLRHPCIVELVGYGELDGAPYLVMEWLDGESLAESIARRGALPLDEALPILDAIAAALGAAHAEGIVHRDLKAANVFLAGERVMLLDFGIAKLLDPDAGGLTTAGTKLGTPHYMAPEQILGRDIDARADIYALGILAFELLTGRRPFDGANFVEIEERQLVEPPPAVSRLAAVPSRIDAVLARALAKDPAQRHATTAELVADLHAASSGAPSTSVPAAPTLARAAGVAIYASTSVAPDAPDLDDALDALDAAVADLRASALAAGFSVAAELGSSLLLVASPSSSALDDVVSLARSLCRRPSLPAGASLVLTVHVGDVELEQTPAGPGFVGGPLLDVGAWTTQ